MRWRLAAGLERTPDCWPWRTYSGLPPRVRVDGRQRVVSHIAWRVAYGEWPVTSSTLMVAHACGNGACVRPRHLALLSPREFHRLRSLRLQLAEERRCEWCERAIWVKRWDLQRGHHRFCTARCRRSAGL